MGTGGGYGGGGGGALGRWGPEWREGLQLTLHCQRRTLHRLHCHHQSDFCMKIGSDDESHWNASCIVRG